MVVVCSSSWWRWWWEVGGNEAQLNSTARTIFLDRGGRGGHREDFLINQMIDINSNNEVLNSILDN